jgi:hypothetical protein
VNRRYTATSNQLDLAGAQCLESTEECKEEGDERSRAVRHSQPSFAPPHSSIGGPSRFTHAEEQGGAEMRGGLLTAASHTQPYTQPYGRVNSPPCGHSWTNCCPWP